MSERFIRTSQILGNKALEKLNNSHVALFGVGGVGGYVLESLVRSGVGHIDIYDKDIVDISNLNRQIIATTDSIGQVKVEVAKNRAKQINPEVEINIFNVFYLPENAADYDLSKYDYIVDAIDTVSAKLTLIENAKKSNVPIISCMGAGNKLDPLGFRVADISQTSICPLAKVMRRELKKRNIENVKVVFSIEQGKVQNDSEEKTIGSLVTVVGSAGLLLANEVIKDLIK